MQIFRISNLVLSTFAICDKGILLLNEGVKITMCDILLISEDRWQTKVIETEQKCIKCNYCEPKRPKHSPIPEVITKNYDFINKN